MTNLLSHKEQQIIGRERRRRGLTVSLVFLLMLMLLGVAALVPSLLLARSKYQGALSQLSTFEELAARREGESVWNEIRGTRDELSHLGAVVQHIPVTLDIASVAAFTGTGVRVEGLELSPVSVSEDDVENGTLNTPVTVRSVVIHGRATTRDALLTFVRHLERNPRFSGVELPVSNLAARADIPFALTITVSPELE